MAGRDVFVYDPENDPRRILLTEDLTADPEHRYGLLVRNGRESVTMMLPAEVVDELSLDLRTATKQRRIKEGR